ncbi:hypothetical protein GD429_20925 [Burkholderia sp. BE17]|nr:hypothetical protein [Burkholderia sp. BE17]
MSFFGNCGTRHGVVIERCDPSVAARNQPQRGGEAGRLSACPEITGLAWGRTKRGSANAGRPRGMGPE